MAQNIHATSVSLDSKGILLIGPSGSGKSDMALKLIANYGAKLVSDDRTDITQKGNVIYASAPENIKGLLEVRGVGIINVKNKSRATVKAVFELTSEKIERYPVPQKYQLLGVELPFFKINPFEASASAKILASLSLL